jgi:hypothetical protein
VRIAAISSTASAPGSSRLKKLVWAQNKLFAEQGQINGFTHLHQHVKTTLKKLLIGEHGQTTSPPCGIGLRNGHRIEIITDDSLTGAGLFDLSNHRRLNLSPLECASKILVGGNKLIFFFS